MFDGVSVLTPVEKKRCTFAGQIVHEYALNGERPIMSGHFFTGLPNDGS